MSQGACIYMMTQASHQNLGISTLQTDIHEGPLCKVPKRYGVEVQKINNKWKAGPFSRLLRIFCDLVGGHLVRAKMAAGGVHFGGGATPQHSLSKHPLPLGRPPPPTWGPLSPPVFQ